MTDTLSLTWGSHSANSTYRTCNRKWWLQSVQKMKSPPTKSQAMGTAFHAAKERYYKSPEALPFESLFPIGWEVVTEKTGHVFKLNGEEQKSVKDRIYQQIEAGILIRKPGMQSVEQQFKYKDESRGIGYIQYVDLIEFDPRTKELRVIDSKTSKKSMYLLRQDDLKNDPQLKAYAYSAMSSFKVDSCIIGQHQAIWDPTERNPVRQIYDRMDLPTAKTHFLSEMDTTLEMRSVAARFDGQEPDKAIWDIPGPNKKGACEEYGGCPFTSICCRRETVVQWKQRNSLEARIEAAATLPTSTALALPAFAMNANPFANAAPAPANPFAAPPVAGKNTVYQPGVLYDITPHVPAPWRDPSCAKCGGFGFFGDGSICPACMAKAMSGGLIQNAADWKLSPGRNPDGSQAFRFTVEREIKMGADGKQIRELAPAAPVNPFGTASAPAPAPAPASAPTNPFSSPAPAPAPALASAPTNPFSSPAPAPAQAPTSAAPWAAAPAAPTNPFGAAPAQAPAPTNPFAAAAVAATVPPAFEAQESEEEAEDGSEAEETSAAAGVSEELKHRDPVAWANAVLAERRAGKRKGRKNRMEKEADMILERQAAGNPETPLVRQVAVAASSQVQELELLIGCMVEQGAGATSGLLVLQSVENQLNQQMPGYQGLDLRDRANCIVNLVRANPTKFVGTIAFPSHGSYEETVLMNALRAIASRVVRGNG